MPQPPSICSRDVVKAFESFGWQVVRQSGSHIIMFKEGRIATLSVPNHNPVAKGTLRSLIRNAGLSVGEFTAAL